MTGKNTRPGPRAGRKRRVPRRVSIGCLLALLCPWLAWPQSIDSDATTFFPSDVSEFGFVDLTIAGSPYLYAQLGSQLVPANLGALEQFLDIPLMGGAQVERILWAAVQSDSGPRPQESPNAKRGKCQGEEGMGLVFGAFHPEAALAFLSGRRVPSTKISKYTAYPVVDFNDDPAYAPPPPGGAMWLIYVNPTTVAFGSRRLLTEMISVHEGNGPSLAENDSVMALIDSVENDSMFWGVFDARMGRTLVQQFIPNVVQPNALRLLAKLGALSVNVDASLAPRLEIDFRAESGTPSVAWQLAQLLARGVQERSEALHEHDPDLANLLNAAQVYSIGSEVAVTVVVDENEPFRSVSLSPFSVR